MFERYFLFILLKLGYPVQVIDVYTEPSVYLIPFETPERKGFCVFLAESQGILKEVVLYNMHGISLYRGPYCRLGGR